MRFKTLAFIILACLFEVLHAQKGEKSIYAGLLLSFPTQKVLYTNGTLKTGFGLEVTGQSNISKNSALLLQTSLAGYGYTKYVRGDIDDRLVLFALKGGYRYQFGTTGIFLNGMAGVDIDITDFYAPLTTTIGVGKRFAMKGIYFIDAGIDYTESDNANRINIKAAFSILRRPKPESNRLL